MKSRPNLFFKVCWISLSFLILSPIGFAQTKSKAPAGFVVGLIEGEDPVVYREADFDSKPWLRLQNGKRYWVSKKLQGPFHQIQIRPGSLGYIPDSDVLVPEELKKSNRDKNESKDKEKNAEKRDDKKSDKNSARNAEKNAEKRDEARSKARLAKPYMEQAFQGVGLHLAQFKEDTMGAKQQANVTWLGYQLSGNNALLEGSESDAGVMLGFSAPQYYRDVTGNSANGMSFLAYVVPQFFSGGGANQYSYFGIGPFFRYSHVEAELNLGSKKQIYNLDDMALGLLVQLGLAHRFSREFSTRLEARYYFDREPYLGVSLSFLFPFDPTKGRSRTE